jgi:energy-coupling factor transport system substrate-specific component
MKLVQSIKKDFNIMTWVLIPVAIAINVVIGEIVVLLKLPVYLDSIGTVLVAVICGPWAGALTGTLSNIVWGLAIDPNAFPWFPVALFIGFTAGWCAKFGLFKSWWKVIIAGFFVMLAAVIVGSPISVYLYGGITASGSSFITAFLLESGKGVLQSVLTTNFIAEPIDKITTCLLAFAIIQGLSVRYLARFPRPENVKIDKQEGKTQLTITLVGIAVLLVIITILFILLKK